MAGVGKATLTLALDSWKDGQVAPSRHTIDVIVPKFPLRLEPVSPRLRKSLVHPDRGSSLTVLAYAPDGKRLLAGDGPGVVQVWEVATGKALVKITTGADAGFCVAPDGKTLYAGRMELGKVERIEKGGKKLFRWDFAGDVRAWDLATGRLIHTYRHDPPRGIRSLVLAPDGAHFLTSELLPGEREGKPKAACTLWDVKTGSCRQLPEGLYGDLAVFAPDGRTLAIPERTEDYRVTAIQLRDVETGRKKVSIPARGATLGSFAFSPDGKLLVGQVREGNNERHGLRFWEPATGQLLASHEGIEGVFFLPWMVFSPDSRTLAVTTRPEGRLLLFDLTAPKLAKVVPLGAKVPGARVVVREPAFSPDGKWVAVATQVLPESIRGTAANAQDLPQPHIHLVDVAAGEVRETLVCPQAYTISVCFSPDGKTLAAGGPGKVLLFDLTSGSLQRKGSVGRLSEPSGGGTAQTAALRRDGSGEPSHEAPHIPAVLNHSRIERRIVREPSYRSKPRYCLLVFGPEAKTRVWLVQDGDTLYVDRNGNGDLTEPAEKVAAKKREECDGDDRSYTFEAGELREGGRRHLNLFVRVGDLSRLQYTLPEAKSLLERDPRARQYSVGLDVEKPGYHGLGPGGRLDQRAGLDGKGLLQFAGRPQDAPIIHFGGPWTLGLYQHTTLWLDRSNLLALIIGTPGLGAGSFAYLDYRGVIPEDLAPRVEIAFPPRKPGGPPVLVRCELKERC